MSQNSTTPGMELQYEAGKIVSLSLLPGYVVLSFLISYVGAWTTLELINRRTSSKGLYNWSLLAGAAVAMGGIGIWCMHFIGNRAIVLGDGSLHLQIAYGGGLTAISFFLPIVVVFMAFAAVGAHEEISLVRLGLGGTLAGLGICGMHYLGQASIKNYDCIYYVSFVIGAAIIAIVAATAALGLFFVFRATWNAAWWKRATCALILAGAVSGMHWLAAVGTQYRLRDGARATTNSSRNATTISVIVLASSSCPNSRALKLIIIVHRW
jgi:NO-binding membrane sensor protein with MHYT domain